MLTAFILDIDRFDTPGKLVAYFGVLPIEVVQRRRPRRPGPRAAALRHEPARQRPGAPLSVDGRPVGASAATRRCGPCTPASSPSIPQHKAVAVGHAMRKLLHLVFAVWKSGRPFDPDHYPLGGAGARRGRRHGTSAARPGTAGARRRARPRATSRSEAGADSGHRGLCRHA